jgi:hypothetical protein
MTPSGTDVATFLLVAECVNKLRYRVPNTVLNNWLKMFSIILQSQQLVYICVSSNKLWLFRRYILLMICICRSNRALNYVKHHASTFSRWLSRHHAFRVRGSRQHNNCWCFLLSSFPASFHILSVLIDDGNCFCLLRGILSTSREKYKKSFL